MIITKELKVKWNPKNRKHYEERGYTFTKYNDLFIVFVEDVPKRSKVKVLVSCDYCGEEYYATLSNLNRKSLHPDIHCCLNCRNKKTSDSMIELYGESCPIKVDLIKEKIKATNVERYGYENSAQNKEIMDKVRKTMIERYGVEHALQNEEIKSKMKDKILSKYGVNSVMQVPEIKEKVRNTSMQKYGVDNPSKSKQVIEKAKATCVKKYGGESSQSSPQVRQKSMKTLLKNGTMPMSKAEIEMVQKISLIYGEDNCIPQYPFDRLSFDCLLIYNGINIDVEFDGKYWHNLHREKDDRRDYFVTRRGYKVLRFIGESNTPTEEQIKFCVDYLVNNPDKIYKMKI